MKAIRTGAVLLTVIVILLGSAITGAQVQRAEYPAAVSGPLDGRQPVTIPEGFGSVAATQVIPEGCVGYGFESWLVVCNSDYQDAQVIVVLMTSVGYFQTEAFWVHPNQRKTLDINRMVSMFRYGFECPDVGFKVLSNRRGVYAEVSMFWNGRQGGKSSTGFVEQ